MIGDRILRPRRLSSSSRSAADRSRSVLFLVVGHFPQPGGFFLCFFRAGRLLTGEVFNPKFFGTAGITSDPNRATRRRSTRR